MRKIELLAPVGTKETFIGVINAGADAVYLAAKRFGARSLATNFTKEELKEMISYAHIRNVFVYVAINTLIYDEEFSDLLDLADYLVSNHVDAFIIQDLGVLNVFRSRYPNTKLHASTQMNVKSVEEALFLKHRGISRIILARETNIELIKKIRAEVDIEIEVFVHGALCVSYSGNCLFSSIISNRSGNRGICAQGCRLPFSLLKNNELIKKNEYLLSTKDLNLLDKISELEGLVDSIKIEGRLRSSDYAITAVKTYKKRLNNEKITNKDITDLKQVFNREFTTGLMFGNKSIINSKRPNHIGLFLGNILEFKIPYIKIKLERDININDGIRVVGKKDFGNQVNKILNAKMVPVNSAKKGEIVYLPVLENPKIGDEVYKTSDAVLHEELKIYKKENYKLVALNLEVFAYPNKAFVIKAKDDQNNEITITKQVLELASSKPTTKEEIIDRLNRLGDTPFYIEKIKVNLQDAFIPAKLLNESKREMIDAFINLRTKRKEAYIIEEKLPITIPKKEDKITITIKVENESQLMEALKHDGVTIYYPNHLNNVPKNDNLIPYYPRISFDKTKNSKSIINDLGDLAMSKEGFIISDKYLNIVNKEAINFLVSNKVSRITLSDELDVKRILKLTKTMEYLPNLEVIVYGSYELMAIKSEIISDYDENSEYVLKDPNQNEYIVSKDNSGSTIIKFQRKNIINDIPSLLAAKINTFRLEFSKEKEIEINKIINLTKETISKHLTKDI